jgi:uncharacterized membrane protein YphA (DoxX/SURF4 family)
MNMSIESKTLNTGGDPRWVDAVLNWPLTWLAARIGLTSAYLVGGVTKLLDFQAAAAEQQHFGLNPGWLWAATAIIVELGGSALVISGRYTWFGAGGLGVLTAIATVRANNFWVMQGHERFMAFNSFFEHIGLIAGLIMAALIAEHAKHGPQAGES